MLFVWSTTVINHTVVYDVILDVITDVKTRGSAIAEGPRDVLVNRNSATTKYPYHVALFT